MAEHLQTPFTSDICIKCKICTAACPYAAVTPLFPGPKVVGPQEQRFREPGAPSPDHSLDTCSSCGICTLVCPHMVRRLIGDDQRYLIPGSCVMGGILLLASDTVARVIVAPYILPVAVLTAFLGAPVFIYLLLVGYRR